MQMTAYEMRISDWSSYVCSSDLQIAVAPHRRHADDDARGAAGRRSQPGAACAAGTRLSRHRAADGGHRRAANGQYHGASGAMSERIRNWCAGLSQSERWLVGVGALLTLRALFWALGRPTGRES